jgi:hypothetical protein
MSAACWPGPTFLKLLLGTREGAGVIKSIEVQLVRVETFEGKTFATEVQNIQVADGDVIREMEIPLIFILHNYY